MKSQEKLPRAMADYGKRFEQGLEQMSPFEIKNDLISYAKECDQKAICQFLNAGRGNPNWINTVAREAFFLLGTFAVEEAKLTFELPEEGIAGMPQKEEITKRFENFLKQHEKTPAAHLLNESVQFLTKEGINADDLIHEWVDGIIGDQYPDPDRILKYTELIVEKYLIQEMCDRQTPPDHYDLFATEGGTAAMCYLFNSLKANKLLSQGDRIALMTPIFTPYIEIPQLKEFNFDVVNIQASQLTKEGYHTWQYPENELNKLKDPSIKLLCLVNPSNPPSYSLDEATHKRIIKIVRENNPNLMIITDDVYATFIPHFRSMMAELPKNTLCVYSFSKYFGATGWRLAVIALHQDNIYDRMIRELPRDKQELLKKRYSSLSLHPEDIRFIDRMVADSRQVALNHTAGLSLPQQTQMSLFASFALLDAENTYKKRMQDMIHERLHTLWESTGFTLLDDPLRAGYYSEIDMLVWAKKFYGDDFVEYLKKNYEPLDVVFRLAQETSLVLLNGGGFDAPEWSIRASLANLKREDYVRIGEGIASILHSYAQRWKESLDK